MLFIFSIWGHHALDEHLYCDRSHPRNCECLLCTHHPRPCRFLDDSGGDRWCCGWGHGYGDNRNDHLIMTTGRLKSPVAVKLNFLSFTIVPHTLILDSHLLIPQIYRSPFDGTSVHTQASRSSYTIYQQIAPPLTVTSPTRASTQWV